MWVFWRSLEYFKFSWFESRPSAYWVIYALTICRCQPDEHALSCLQTMHRNCASPLASPRPISSNCYSVPFAICYHTVNSNDQLANLNACTYKTDRQVPTLITTWEESTYFSYNLIFILENLNICEPSNIGQLILLYGFYMIK